MSSHNRYIEALATHPGPEVTLSFRVVAAGLGWLPPAALNNPQWWFNTNIHGPASLWISIGWRVASVDMYAQRVTFRRMPDGEAAVNETGRSSGREDRRDPSLAIIILTVAVTALGDLLIGIIPAAKNTVAAIGLFTAAGAINLLREAISHYANHSNRSGSVKRWRRTVSLVLPIMVALAGVAVAAMPFRGQLKPIYAADFSDPTREWPTGMQADRSTRTFTGDSYQVTTISGRADWMDAPPVQTAAGIRIEATASLASGEGGWGVFCRETPNRLDRYEFSITHASIAYIKKGDSYETSLKHLQNFDPQKPNHLSVECMDRSDATGVELKMSINNKVIFDIGDTVPPRVLGPGASGIHAFAFGGDISGETATVRFKQLAIYRLK